MAPRIAPMHTDEFIGAHGWCMPHPPTDFKRLPPPSEQPSSHNVCCTPVMTFSSKCKQRTANHESMRIDVSRHASERLRPCPSATGQILLLKSTKGELCRTSTVLRNLMAWAIRVSTATHRSVVLASGRIDSPQARQGVQFGARSVACALICRQLHV